MVDEFDASQGKSLTQLGYEAGWFLGHTCIAVFSLLLLAVVGLTMHVSPDTSTPKLVGTVLAFLVPLIVGFIVARATRNPIGRYVWISGLLIFSVVCVWVLDLPTGNGLCEHCGALEKLWRTFFAINNGSGLLSGNGLLVGTWVPLSLFGYALGARAGYDE